MLARESIENEPQINADERRLNVSSLDIQDAIFEDNKIFDVAFGKNREGHLNLRRRKGLDKNHFGIKQKPLTIINDKSRATNLRSSAFICGLNKSYNSRQSNFILRIKYQSLLFVNQISVSFFYPKKDGAAYG